MNIRKSFVAVLVSLVSMLGMAETATVDGLLWQYSVAEGKATIEKLLTPGVENVVIPSEINGKKVIIIGEKAFYGNDALMSVFIPEGVTVIGMSAFGGCVKLLDANFPSTLKRIEDFCFDGCRLRYVRFPCSLEYVGWRAVSVEGTSVLVVEGSQTVSNGEYLRFSGGVEFLDHVPQGLLSTRIFNLDSDQKIAYPKEYAEEWSAIVPLEKFGGYVPENKCEVAVVSTMRERAPTIMDVKVTPIGTMVEVKIRPVAFLNGVNSFANVIKVKTFTDGTESVVQNPIKVNQENVFSWNVAADLTDKVAKLKMDVMCVEDEVIPLELVSIPASSGHEAMTISRNVIAPMRIRDGLMWLLASPMKDIEVGVVKSRDELQLRRDGNVIFQKYSGIDIGLSSYDKMLRNGVMDLLMCRDSAVKRFVLEELGYTILEGDDLEYARKMTGLKLENGPYVKMK